MGTPFNGEIPLDELSTQTLVNLDRGQTYEELVPRTNQCLSWLAMSNTPEDLPEIKETLDEIATGFGRHYYLRGLRSTLKNRHV